MIFAWTVSCSQRKCMLFADGYSEGAGIGSLPGEGMC